MGELSKPTKSVIVIRKDLNMRRGKEIAQTGHAFIGLYKQALKNSDEFKNWENTGTTKIGLCINSEEELLNLVNMAQKNGINVYLVTDSGKTEFTEPTITCAAFGPAFSEDLDKITGNLKLY